MQGISFSVDVSKKPLLLVFLSDIHIGSRGFDETAFDKTINEINDYRSTHEVRVVLLGDLADFIALGDKRFSGSGLHPKYKAEDLDNLIQLQIDEIVERLLPIKDLLTAVGLGNHETKWMQQHCYDIYKDMVKRLGVQDFQIGYVGGIGIHLNKGSKRLLYKIAVQHGYGGASVDEKGPIKRCIKYFQNFMADLCVMAHMHRIDDHRGQLQDMDNSCRYVITRPKWYLCTGGYQRKFVADYQTYSEHYPSSVDIGYAAVEITIRRIAKRHPHIDTVTADARIIKRYF